MNETLFQLLLAVIVGGLIGAEREFRTGTGLRTLMLICLGATLFTIYSDIFSFGEGDPRRIAAAVVTGVGFLGAGMILRQQGGIIGLTTAASVWLVAALGMGIGIGQYLIVAVASVFVLLILWAIPLLQRVTRARETLTYNVLTPLQMDKYPDLQEILKTHDLQVTQSTMDKEKDGIRYLWQVYGKPERHIAAMQAFIDQDYVQEFQTIK